MNARNFEPYELRTTNYELHERYELHGTASVSVRHPHE